MSARLETLKQTLEQAVRERKLTYTDVTPNVMDAIWPIVAAEEAIHWAEAQAAS